MATFMVLKLEGDDPALAASWRPTHIVEGVPANATEAELEAVAKQGAVGDDRAEYRVVRWDSALERVQHRRATVVTEKKG